tara:strand:- start:634 stop:1599 length:966 start_codon:yes stop_codon:yes gene_type:complete
MKKKIILIAGDPNSINSEIIYKTWQKINQHTKNQIFLIGNFSLIKKQLKIIKLNLPMIQVKKLDDKIISKKLKIINVPLNFKKPFDVSMKDARKYISKSFDLAHKLCKNKEVSGLINCPLDKRLISSTKIIGVTELLSSKNNIPTNSEVMLIHNKKISVVPLTTHMKIKNVSSCIKKGLILKKIDTLRKGFKQVFNKDPKIAILGLNPHNAELIKDSEERKVISPAISMLKKRGFKIKGPYSADTIFINKYKEFDVIVGMYHDQVLSPFKSLFHFDAINLTLGLKYLRVSPDHGPAKDLIYKKKANYQGLLTCIKFINKHN